MSKPDAPQHPIMLALPMRKGAANLDAARATSKLSNPEWDNAQGSRRIEYGIGGDPDRVRIIDSMTPQAQEQYNLGQGINTNLLNTAASGLNRVTNQMATPFDMSKVPNAPNLPQSSDATRSAVASALMSRLDPQFQRDEDGTHAHGCARHHARQRGVEQRNEPANAGQERRIHAGTDSGRKRAVAAVR